MNPVAQAERDRKKALEEELAQERRERLVKQRRANDEMRAALAAEWREETRPEREEREAEDRAAYHSEWLVQGREYIATLESRLASLEAETQELREAITPKPKKQTAKKATKQ